MAVLYGADALLYSSLYAFHRQTRRQKIRQDHALNAIMPYMMRGRNESAVYYDKEIDVENALRHIRTKIPP